jgi:molecular chaperone GrpE
MSDNEEKKVHGRRFADETYNESKEEVVEDVDGTVEEKSDEPQMQYENEPQSEVDILNRKIADQTLELDEKEDRIKRLMAEFENFKKRSEKERTLLYNSVMGDVATKLLPVVDNLEKAANANTEDKSYQEGIEMVLKQFKDVLDSNGVKEIEAVGKPFDPSLHEAVGTVQDDSLDANTVKEEYRKGYMIGDKVLRHSLVVVANA